MPQKVDAAKGSAPSAHHVSPILARASRAYLAKSRLALLLAHTFLSIGTAKLLPVLTLSLATNTFVKASKVMLRPFSSLASVLKGSSLPIRFDLHCRREGHDVMIFACAFSVWRTKTCLESHCLSQSYNFVTIL